MIRVSPRSAGRVTTVGAAAVAHRQNAMAAPPSAACAETAISDGRHAVDLRHRDAIDHRRPHERALIRLAADDDGRHRLRGSQRRRGRDTGWRCAASNREKERAQARYGGTRDPQRVIPLAPMPHLPCGVRPGYSKRDATSIRSNSGQFPRVLRGSPLMSRICCPQNGSTVRTAQDSAMQNDQYRDRGSRLAVRGSRFAVRGSPVRGSRFAIDDSGFRDSGFRDCRFRIQGLSIQDQ